MALVRSLAGVDASVRVQVAPTIEGFPARVAFVWALASMCHLMSQRNRFVSCNKATHTTLERALFRGKSQMNWLARTMTHSSQVYVMQNGEILANDRLIIEERLASTNYSTPEVKGSDCEN